MLQYCYIDFSPKRNVLIWYENTFHDAVYPKEKKTLIP